MSCECEIYLEDRESWIELGGAGMFRPEVLEPLGIKVPTLAFGLGIERLLLRLEENGVEIPKPDAVKLYIAPMGEGAISAAQKLAYDLRKAGVSVDTDHLGRGLRASMKYADKLGAQNTLVLGDNEIETGTAKIKNMATGEETEVSLDAIAEYFG